MVFSAPQCSFCTCIHRIYRSRDIGIDERERKWGSRFLLPLSSLFRSWFASSHLGLYPQMISLRRKSFAFFFFFYLDLKLKGCIFVLFFIGLSWNMCKSKWVFLILIFYGCFCLKVWILKLPMKLLIVCRVSFSWFWFHVLCDEN